MKLKEIIITVVITLALFTGFMYAKDYVNEYRHPKLKIQRLSAEVQQDMDEINDLLNRLHDLQVQAGTAKKDSNALQVYALDPDLFKQPKPKPPIAPEATSPKK